MNIRLVCAAVCALFLAACGASVRTRTVTTVHTATGPTPPSAGTPCPPNRSRMGCNTPRPLELAPKLTAPAGLEFPDVSVWQGAVNWPAVAGWQRQHGWQPFAVYKMGEYTLDSQALRNSQQTRANHVVTWGYWFVRNTGCSHEAGLIKWAAQYLQLKRVILDTEVPEARGYDVCLTPPLEQAGLTVAEYTSPGSNPDSSNPRLDIWTAAFGPAHTPCVWTCSVGQLDRQTIIAWQFTDGTYGPVVTVPGIGHDDVSVDYGMSKLGAAPAPAPHPAPTPTPAPVVSAAQLKVLLDTGFPSRWGTLNERNTGAQFLGAIAHRDKFRSYLHGLLHAKLSFLADRIYQVAVVEHKGWAGSRRGSRYQFLVRDAQAAASA